MRLTKEETVALIKNYQKITFLTGAGVSTPSGVPDYRSLEGVYHGLDTPEYLLSKTCFLKESEKFYTFVKNLYHPKAKPNIIHEKIAAMTQKKATLVTQNIDGLHQKAGTKQMVPFHGNLYDIYCTKCQQHVDYQEYLTSDRHQSCGGYLRPDIILYEENLPIDRLLTSSKYVREADLIVVVGTSLKVYPFAGLIAEKSSKGKVLLINQEDISYQGIGDIFIGKGQEIFKEL